MKNSTKVLSGAIAALAIGVAATLFLKSKTGKKFRAEASDMMGDFYKVIAPRLKKIKKMSHEEYKTFMKQAAQHYGKAKKMSEDKIKDLAREAQNSWKHFSKHLGK